MRQRAKFEPNHHLAKVVRLGEVRDDVFEIVYSTDQAVPPFLGINLLKKPRALVVTGLIQIKAGSTR